MCSKCDDIDYPVADIWRPCYVPSGRRSPGYIPTSPRGGFHDTDVEPLRTIQNLSAIIRKQKAEISALKASQGHKTANPFEGPEAS